MNAITTTAPRRVWPWVLGGLLLLCLLALGSGTAWVMSLAGPGDGWHNGWNNGWHGGLHDGVHVVFDGEDWSSDGPGTVLAVLAGLLAGGAALVVGLLAVLVLVPLGVALALLGVALGIAAAVCSVLAVMAALLLPLWLPLVLLWLLLRRKPSSSTPIGPGTARMAA